MSIEEDVCNLVSVILALYLDVEIKDVRETINKNAEKRLKSEEKK